MVSHKELQDKKYSKHNSFANKEYYYANKAFENIIKLSKKIKFEKILDIGCADGGFLSQIGKKTKAKLYGIDISKDAVRIAKEKGVEARVYDVEKRLPFPDSRFDLVTCLQVIEHVYDTDHLLREINRVLKINGIMVISTFNLLSFFNRIKMFIGIYPNGPEYKPGGAGHIRVYTSRKFVKHVKEHGFVLKKIVSPNFHMPMRNKSIPSFIKKIAIKMGDYFPHLCGHTIIIARKK